MRYRHLRRTLIALLAALAFVLVVAWLAQAIMATRAARAWTARRLEGVLSKRLDGEVTIGDLRWQLVSAQLCIEDLSIRLHGMSVRVDHLCVDLARIVIPRPTLELGTVAATGVHLELEGGLPTTGRSHRSPVRVVIRQLALHDVSIQGKGLPGIAECAVDGIAASWTTEGGHPAGVVSADAIRVKARGLEPLTAAAAARFQIADGLVALPRWRVTGEGFELAGSARISANGAAAATAKGWLETAELDRVVRAGKVLRGRLLVDATFHSVEPSVLKVSVRSSQIGAAGFPVSDLEGHLTIEGGQLIGTVEHALFHGGELSGTYRLGILGSPYPHTIDVAADGVQVARLLRNLGVPPAGLSGRARIETHLEWSGTNVREGHGKGVADIKAEQGALPASGTLSAELAGDGLLRFAGDGLQIGSSQVSWQGPLSIGSWEPAWSFRASPAAVGEIIPMVNTWIGSTVLPPEIDGQGTLTVSVAGPWRQLQVGLRLDAHPLSYPPITLDRVVAEASIGGSELRLGPARYQIGEGGGEVDGTISWSESASEALDLTLRGQRIPLEEIARWLGRPGEATGALAFTGGLRGSIASPRGSWALGLGDVTVAGLDLGDGSARVDLGSGVFQARGLSFAGGLGGELRWAVSQEEVAGSLHWAAMPLAMLGQTSARLLGNEAEVDLDFAWPVGGIPLGFLEARSEELDARVSFDTREVRADATLAGCASAYARLDRRPDNSLDGSGELVLESAEALLSRLLPAAAVPLTGVGRVELGLSVPAGGTPRITGRAVSLELELDKRPVRLLEPATFAHSGAAFELDGVRLGVGQDEVFFRCASDDAGTLSGNLAGTLDALLLRFLVPSWEPAGRVTGVVELLGTTAAPAFEGIARIDNGSFRIPGSHTVISALHGTVLLSAQDAVLDDVDFRFQRGLGRARGQIARHDGKWELALDGVIAQMAYDLFPGLEPRVSGTWRLVGPVDDLRLSGDLDVDRATVRRRDDIALILADWFGSVGQEQAPSRPHLQLHVEADQTIEAHGPFFNLTGSATLDVGGTPAQPGIVGKVELETGGEITFQGVRYEIERATVTFSDPLRIAAFIDFQARAWIESYQVVVRLVGTPERLVPSVSSDPPLAEAEIYSLLALGHRDEEVGVGAISVGVASTLLTRQINAELERRAQMILPVDQVRVDPFAESSTGNPAARVTVVKQLSPTWTIILQSNISAAREEVVVSRWALGPGLFIEATRDIDGSYAVDLKLRRRY